MIRVLIVSPDSHLEHAMALQRHAPQDVEVVVQQSVPWDKLGEFDVYFRTQAPAWVRQDHRRIIDRGIYVRHMVEFTGKDFQTLRSFSKLVCGTVITRYACHANTPNPHLWHLPNAVDTEVYQPRVPISQRPRIILCAPIRQHWLWNVIYPLEYELQHHGYQLRFLDTPTPDDYNSAQFYLAVTYRDDCRAIRAAACGCVVIPTGRATIDWLDSAEHVTFTTDDIVMAVIELQKQREAMSARSVEAAQQRSYVAPGRIAEYYYRLWKRLSMGDDVPAFRWRKLQPERV